MEGGEWKLEVEVGCPPWASVGISTINITGIGITNSALVQKNNICGKKYTSKKFQDGNIAHLYTLSAVLIWTKLLSCN